MRFFGYQIEKYLISFLWCSLVAQNLPSLDRQTEYKFIQNSILMKKFLFSLMAAGLLSTGAIAQDVTFGPMVGAGANIITVNVDPEPEGFEAENTSGFGFFVGGFANLGLTDQISIRPELHYAMRMASDNESTTIETPDGFGGTVTTTTENDINSRDSFLEIPILLGYQVADGFNLHVGPSLGLLLGSKVTGESTTTVAGETTTVDIDDDGTDGRNGFEFGLALGANYMLPSGLGFGVRYTRAFTDVLEDTDFGGVTFNQNYNLVRVNISYTLGQ